MNIKASLLHASQKLSHLENPNLEAEVLLAAVMQKGRTWLKTYPETELTKPEEEQFTNWIEQRSNHVPVAYITGTVNWNGLTLAINEHTLIPRDETETLCHHIKESQPRAPKTILDIGTGSGCIAIWLSQQYSAAEVTALDISPQALTVAKANAKTQRNIHFLESNLLGEIKEKTHFDLIVANLPYVPEDLIVTAEVDQEPRSAIFSGTDGLDHIRILALQLKNKKITFNQLWLEFLPCQAALIQALFPNNTTTQLFKGVDGQVFFTQITPHA